MRINLCILLVFTLLISCSRYTNINSIDYFHIVDTTQIENFIKHDNIRRAYANSYNNTDINDHAGLFSSYQITIFDINNNYAILKPFRHVIKQDFRFNTNGRVYFTEDSTEYHLWEKRGSLIIIKAHLKPPNYTNNDTLQPGILYYIDGSAMFVEVLSKDVLMINNQLYSRQVNNNCLSQKSFFEKNTQRYAPEFINATNSEYNYNTLFDTVLNNHSMKDSMFMYCINIKNLYIPNNIEVVGSFCFSNCVNLKNITLANQLNTINEFAFHNCWSLEDIKIPNSVREIRDYAFLSCEKLKNVILPDSIVRISQGLFQQCAKLKSIRIPYNVDSIGNFAFLACPKLRKVVVESKIPPNIESFSFDRDNKITFYVPKESLELYKNHDLWSKMKMKPR